MIAKKDFQKKGLSLLNADRNKDVLLELFPGIEIGPTSDYPYITEYSLNGQRFAIRHSTISRLMMYGGWKGDKARWVYPQNTKNAWLIVFSEKEYVAWEGGMGLPSFNSFLRGLFEKGENNAK